MQKFYVIACHVLWREICYFASQSKNVFNINFIKQGLHNTPDILRTELQKAIDSVNEEYSAILIGYGLCGKGVEGIKAGKTRLVLMKGHDCITFFLGSKERYKYYFENNPGTYWYTRGWLETSVMPGEDRYNTIFKEYNEKFGEEIAKYLMETEQGWLKNYSLAAYVDLKIGESEKYKKYTQKCAKWLGWKYEDIEGNSELIKNFLDGNWNSEDFLIVEPGQQIISGGNGNIIEAI